MANELYLYMPAAAGRKEEGGVACLGSAGELAAHLREIELAVKWKESAGTPVSGGGESAGMPLQAFSGVGIETADAERRARAAGLDFDPSRMQALSADEAYLLFGVSSLGCCEPGDEGMQTVLEGRDLAFEMPVRGLGAVSCRVGLDVLRRLLAEAQAEEENGKRCAA